MSATLSTGLRLGLKLALAYRVEALVQLLSASIVALLAWSLWTAVYADRAQVAGRDGPGMITYVLVAWLVSAVHTSKVDVELGTRFREGLIAVDLLRPWDLQLHHYARELGRGAAALALSTLPLLLGAGAWLGLRAPQQPQTWALFGLSLLGAHAIGFGIAWIFGLLAFHLRNAAGLSHLKTTLIGLFSGALIPLDLYPGPLRSFALWLPFQGLSHTPADIFTEHLAPREALLRVGVQLGWALLLALGGRLLLRGALRGLIVQGG